MNMMQPSATVLCKLGSIAVHADEVMNPGAHLFDRIALQGLLTDPEVVEWLAMMDAAAMLPVKRDHTHKEKNMKIKYIRYKIIMTGFVEPVLKTVDGYAVDSPYRICIHAVDGGWMCDDYDTGHRIGELAKHRTTCVKNALAKIKANGPKSYARAKKLGLARLKAAGLL